MNVNRRDSSCYFLFIYLCVCVLHYICVLFIDTVLGRYSGLFVDGQPEQVFWN